MKISSILWKAANERLSWDGWWWPGTNDEFSCLAVRKVTRAGLKDKDKASKFLASLGVDPDAGWLFDEFPEGEVRQGARYLWLMFAYEVAKSEGL